MPLIEPSNRREKLVICGSAGVGKSTCALSICFWSHASEDPRRFWYLDFDDSAGDLLLDEKYKGMNNIEIVETPYDWQAWREASEKVVANAKQGDFIILDMADRGWNLVQAWESETVRNKNQADEKLAAAQAGRVGWDLYKDTNWVVVNTQWSSFIKPILLSSPAHVLMTTEVKDLGGEGRSNDPQNVKDARMEFGRYLPAGQKSIPYQTRSVLRLQKLARGRVLYTLKDRARKELNGDDCPDFFTSYMKNVAGWSTA